MTAEDEEFNRIEMESRIKQEYVRSMKQEMVPLDAVLEMRDYIRQLQGELRNAQTRVAVLEQTNKQEPEEGEYIEVIARWGKRFVEMPNPLLEKGHFVRFYFDQPQRDWVGLTDEEVHECLNGLPTQTIDVYAKRIETKLKEKNT